jgi:hypothetical protein
MQLVTCDAALSVDKGTLDRQICYVLGQQMMQRDYRDEANLESIAQPLAHCETFSRCVGVDWLCPRWRASRAANESGPLGYELVGHTTLPPLDAARPTKSIEGGVVLTHCAISGDGPAAALLQSME